MQIARIYGLQRHIERFMALNSKIIASDCFTVGSSKRGECEENDLCEQQYIFPGDTRNSKGERDVQNYPSELESRVEISGKVDEIHESCWGQSRNLC